MKYKEIKSMSKDEIGSKLKELRMELIKSNAQVATGTVPKNPGQLRQTKKTIAKIMQAMSEAEKAPAAEKAAKKPEAKAPAKTAEKKSESQADKKPKQENKMEESQE